MPRTRPDDDGLRLRGAGEGETAMQVKPAAKALAAVAIHGSGLRHLLAAGRRLAAGGRRVVVIGYHRVCSDYERERVLSIESCLISSETFRRHVEFLAAEFELASMSRAVEVLAGREEASRDLAVITFDDGYREVLTNALPILREANAPATLYVSTGVISQGGFFPHDRLYALLRAWDASERMRARTAPEAGRVVEEARAVSGVGPRAWLSWLLRTRAPAALEELAAALAEASDSIALPPPGARALDWDGVRELAAGGVEIGTHTIGHAVLPLLPEEEIRRELETSKATAEQELKRPMRHFAYCNGYYNDRVIAALRAAGYASAVTTEDRLNRRGQDPFRIARRVLWEGAARGPGGSTVQSLLACQLDDAWRTLGFDASEPGELAPPAVALARDRDPARRLA